MTTAITCDIIGSIMGRFENVEWDLPKNADGGIKSWDAVKVAVLMDIRDELKRLNGVLHCDNFMKIPATLRQIKRNTTKPVRKTVKNGRYKRGGA